MTWRTANEPEGRLPASYYAAITPPYTPAPPLQGSTEAEICVIGGGFTGLSAALHLAEAGRDVVLLEAAQAGWGASGRNGGQIGSGFNWDYDRLEARFGPVEASALWGLAETAKALTRHLIAAHAPEAGYRPGILYASRDPAEYRSGIQYTKYLAERTGYTDLRPLDRSETAFLTGSTAFAAGLLDLGAGHANPLALARGLARAARSAGARFHENTPVQALTSGNSIRTSQGSLRARHVILGLNGYHDGLVPGLATRVLPINNYIAVTEPLGDRAPMTHDHAVADDRFVVNYWRQTEDGRLIYGGGESYGRRFPKDIQNLVRRNLARVYPHLAGIGFTQAWGGTLAVTSTRLPFAAELRPGLLAAGGYSGHGFALACLAGRAMAQRILGDSTDFQRLSRLPTPPFPGGRWLGPTLTNAAFLSLSMRDRLGL